MCVFETDFVAIIAVVRPLWPVGVGDPCECFVAIIAGSAKYFSITMCTAATDGVSLAGPACPRGFQIYNP